MTEMGRDGRRTATVTVLFCDLVSSTARQARIGDDAADQFRREFFAVLGDAVMETGGEVVKNTGDGLMVVFRWSTVDAVTCASRMHDRVESLDLDEPAFVRVGVSAGEAASEDGDWFGTPVVEAARLCARAEAGQTLVSEVVRALVGSRGGHQFRSLGALPLKGLASPLPSAAVVRTPIAAPKPKTRRPRRRWPIGVGAVAVVAGAAISGVMLVSSSGGVRPMLAPVRYVPRFEPSTCSSDFLQQVPGGTCGDLLVPEDRATPSGRWLRVPVTRAPARTTSPSSDPTISIGLGSASDDLATSPARDHSELISITTRVGALIDPAMACPEFEPVVALLLTKPNRDPAVIAAGQPALRACHDRLARSGVALAHYTFDDAANDVVDLARALHLPEVNLVAADTSAPIALGALRDAPRLVRTVTLQNPWLPGTGSIDRTAILADAFDHYVDACDAAPTCARAYPDLRASLRAQWATLNAQAHVADAAEPGAPTTPSEHHMMLLNGDSLAKALANVLGGHGGDPVIAAAIAKTPPLDLIATSALAWYGDQPVHNFAWAMYLSLSCSYPYASSPAHTITSTARPELAGVDDGFFDWACAAWNVPVAPDATAGSASSIPALFVYAPIDAIVPQQPALAAGFPNASVLTLPTLGWDALYDGSPPCLNALRRALLAEPTGHLDTAGCAGQSPPINFVVATT